jgi:hypothetical protein
MQGLAVRLVQCAARGAGCTCARAAACACATSAAASAPAAAVRRYTVTFRGVDCHTQRVNCHLRVRCRQLARPPLLRLRAPPPQLCADEAEATRGRGGVCGRPLNAPRARAPPRRPPPRRARPPSPPPPRAPPRRARPPRPAPPGRGQSVIRCPSPLNLLKDTYDHGWHGAHSDEC